MTEATNPTEESISLDELTAQMGVAAVEAMMLVTQQSKVLARFEITFEATFPDLHDGVERDDFMDQLNAAVVHLGGPKGTLLPAKFGDPEHKWDRFPDTAIAEIIEVFRRARNSVIQTGLYYVGGEMQDANHPDSDDDPEVLALYRKDAKAAFWEQAETAYIRLASYWDRVGMLINFAFFNIRKFDRDGFGSVMDRMHSNAVKMDSRISGSTCWKDLRSFQTSTNEDGYKWLSERRNLMIHSRHFHPLQADETAFYESQHNHLNESYKEKLKPSTPSNEFEFLRHQLLKAKNLFPLALMLVQKAPSKRLPNTVYNVPE